MQGDPKYEASQVVPDLPYAEYARLLGLNGIRVDQPEQVAPAWEAALAANVPTVLEVMTDPNVPPLPPHITSDQAKAYLSALWRRDPDSFSMIKNSARQWWDSIAPGRSKRR